MPTTPPPGYLLVIAETTYANNQVEKTWLYDDVCIHTHKHIHTLLPKNKN